MSLRDAQVELRRHFLDKAYGRLVVVDLAGNWPVWEILSRGRNIKYIGYTGDAPSETIEGILASGEPVDVVDIGDHDPWGLYADVLAHFCGTALTVFLSIPRTALRIEEGLAKYVWERAAIPIDWSKWQGSVKFDGLILRAGLSYAHDRGFVVEEASRFRFVGKPFPWRYNYVGLRLRSDDRQRERPAGVQDPRGSEGGEPPSSCA